MKSSLTRRKPEAARRCLFALVWSLLLVPHIFLSQNARAGDWSDPFTADDIEKYPVPIPVTTVSPVAGLRPLPSLVAMLDTAAVIHAGDNRSVSLALLQVIKSDEIAGVQAPAGMEAIILVTRWENIHPRQTVARAQLEGGADRSFGAGGLLGGGNKADPKDMVELDVAYKVSEPGLHLWLVAAGETYALRAESADLPNGVGPTEPFTVARFGEQRKARFGWFVPKGSQDLELRFFDYENGSVVLPVAGDAANAARGPERKPIDTGSLQELELMVLGSRFADQWAGTPATAGWRYLIVDLLGKSVTTQGGKPGLVYADPTRYLWAVGDGGVFRYGLPPSDGTNTISFTPELPHRQSVAFGVPENRKAFRIGIRGRNGVLSLRATEAEHLAPSSALASATDAGTLELGLLGVRWDGEVLVLDLLATPLAAGKGVELDSAQQFLLKAGDSEYRPDPMLTSRLYGQPPAPFTLPPSTPVAFGLAFSLPAGTVPTALRYRGFSAESTLSINASMLQGQRGVAAGMLAAAPPPAVKPVAPATPESRPGSWVAAPDITGTKPTAAATPAAQGAPTAASSAANTNPTRPSPPVAATPALMPPQAPPQLMPVVLPVFDPKRVVAEKEPNDTFDQATPLGEMLAASGNLSASDRIDRFSFDVKGEPQLWTLEASGAGLGFLEVHGARGNRIGGLDSRGRQKARIDNLQLLPGHYSVGVTASSTGGEYRLRAVPLGRPERENEFEPNDDPSQAQVLRFGELRRGLISDPGDKDMYRFSLDSDTRLALRLVPPADLKLVMTIQGGIVYLTGDRMAKAGELSVYEALLQAGDYRVAVSSEGGKSSDTPYELRLEYLDPFVLPTDLEPNDSPLQAQSLKQVRHFAGAAKTFDDPDWFLLPAVAVSTTASVRFTGGTGLTLRQIEGGRMVSGDLKELARTEQDRSYTAILEPGIPTYFEVSFAGSYSIDFSLEPEPAVAVSPLSTSGLELALTSKPPALAAYRAEAQRVPLAFSITNRSDQPQRVELETESSAEGWRVTPEGTPLTLGPGQSSALRATLLVDADRASAQRLPVYVRARSGTAASTAIELPLQAECGVPAQSPQRDAPLPAALLGGYNVAWEALGATPVADADGRGRQALLYDGMTPLGQSFDVSKFPVDITVKLAVGVMPVAGISLFPTAASRNIGHVPFILLASTDGTAFHEIYRGSLDPAPREHLFVLPAPVQASHVRLHLENPTGLDSGLEAALSEFKVISTPGVTPFAEKGPNIADLALGGQLVWISWPGDPTNVQAMLTEATENRTANIDRLVPVDWVIGFQQQRAARITRLEWQDSSEADNGSRRPQQVAVAASVEGPLGPWLPLSEWVLARDATGLAVLELATPVWARYMRFSMPGDDKGGRWRLAETLRVFEQVDGKDYRSILAEWGHYRRDAFYETQLPDTVRLGAGAQGGGAERDLARALNDNEKVAGRAQAGVRDEWFRIKVPAGLDRLELRFGGNGRSRLLPVVQDHKGNPVELREADADAGQRIFYALVRAGSEVWLKVAEAPRSIMVIWDNSGSTGQFHDGMYQSFARLADDIKPGFEVVNLMPLGETGVTPLMKDWSSNPVDIKTAVGGINRGSGSSNAENTLLAAIDHFDKRSGNRAIVLMTDAESGGGSLNSKLWQGYREVRPRVFALELQIEGQTEPVSHYQDLMQNWAAVNHGDYRVFRSQSDLDHAFERAACLMRSPAEYSVSWLPAPGKGNLQVVWESGKAMAGAAVELVLDASGSMRSAKTKVDGKLKMEVAREVMHEIIQALPDDTQVGLRVYGHRVREGTTGDCEDSELISPIATLDRASLSAAVSQVQALGTTPIAYSIGKACEDLANIEGPKLLVVITDGKEECKGDPQAAVAACRAVGLDVRVDIVGFALADAKDKSDMENAAIQGAGRFFDAQDRSALSAAIEESLAMPFEVFDSRETSIGQGLTGLQGLALYEGNYTVAVRTASGDVTVRDVAIRKEKTTTVHLSRDGDSIGFRTEKAQ